MFTGIIEELGKIQEIKSNRITVKCGTVIKDAKLGDSIAVNGVCLTVVEILPDGFVADISPEAFKVTAFNLLFDKTVIVSFSFLTIEIGMSFCLYLNLAVQLIFTFFGISCK